MNRRTFTAIVGGERLHIPTTMAVLREAEQISGVSMIECIIDQKFVGPVQALITYALKAKGRKVTFEEVGEMCSFAETRDNLIEFLNAFTPDVTAEDSPKNELAGEQIESTGNGSSDVGMESSS